MSSSASPSFPSSTSSPPPSYPLCYRGRGVEPHSAEIFYEATQTIRAENCPHHPASGRHSHPFFCKIHFDSFADSLESAILPEDIISSEDTKSPDLGTIQELGALEWELRHARWSANDHTPDHSNALVICNFPQNRADLSSVVISLGPAQTAISALPAENHLPVISLVGDTGSGKSRLLRTLLPGNRPKPIPGSPEDICSVSVDLHAYTGPLDSAGSSVDCLFIDSEGFGGTMQPKAMAQIRKAGHSIAEDDSMTQARAETVNIIFPRLLYLHSDVLVYVINNVKNLKWKDQVSQWPRVAASASSNTSRPHLILVFNSVSDQLFKKYRDPKVALAQLVTRYDLLTGCQLSLWYSSVSAIYFPNFETSIMPFRQQLTVLKEIIYQKVQIVLAKKSPDSLLAISSHLFCRVLSTSIHFLRTADATVDMSMILFLGRSRATPHQWENKMALIQQGIQTVWMNLYSRQKENLQNERRFAKRNKSAFSTHSIARVNAYAKSSTIIQELFTLVLMLDYFRNSLKTRTTIEISDEPPFLYTPLITEVSSFVYNQQPCVSSQLFPAPNILGSAKLISCEDTLAHHQSTIHRSSRLIRDYDAEESKSIFRLGILHKMKPAHWIDQQWSHLWLF